MVTKTLQIACYLQNVQFSLSGMTSQALTFRTTELPPSSWRSKRTEFFPYILRKSRRWRQNVPPKRWHLYTTVYGFTYQNTEMAPMSEPEISYKRFIFRVKPPLSVFILYAHATCLVQTIHESLSHFCVSPAISAFRNHKKLPSVQDRSPKFTNCTHTCRGNSKLLAYGVVLEV
jgi:hypothetical protein